MNDDEHLLMYGRKVGRPMAPWTLDGVFEKLQKSQDWFKQTAIKCSVLDYVPGNMREDRDVTW